jgi:type II secretory pathway predicted ATPase ExeA
MINNYFGFSKNPFSKNINDKEIFKYNAFENVQNRLQFFLKENGIFLLTGLIGSGKTTALRLFYQSLNPNLYKVIYLNESFDTKRDLYRTILEKLDIKPPFISGDARSILKKSLLDMYFVKRTTPVIIFDEAQNHNGFILEEIRLLSNFDFDSLCPVSIILSGHNLLKQRLSLNENEALNQRLTVRFHFSGLNLDETCSYIKHCLTIANSSSVIFTDSVINKIYETSHGVVRKINLICNNLLLSAVSSGKKIVDDYVFEQTKNEWE